MKAKDIEGRLLIVALRGAHEFFAVAPEGLCRLTGELVSGRSSPSALHDCLGLCRHGFVIAGDPWHGNFTEKITHFGDADSTCSRSEANSQAVIL